MDEINDGIQVPTYSEALIQLKEDYSCWRETVECSSRIDEASLRHSSQKSVGISSGYSSETELQVLRNKNIENGAIIRMLKQKLKSKDDYIEQMNDKRKQNEKMIEDLKHQLDDSKAHRKEIIKLLTGELRLKDVNIQKLNDVHTKNTEEFINQLAKSREAYDKQIKNLAVMMASITEENRRENEEAIEMLSNQMAEVMHLLEDKQ